MFRNSKLLFWTCEILLLTVIFLYLEINGDFNFSICICSEYHPLTIFNCRFFILHYQSDCWIVGKTFKNQACVWDFDHLSPLVWDHWLRDLLSAPYLDQSVNQLDQFDPRIVLGSPKFVRNYRPILCFKILISNQRFNNWISLIWISYKISWIVWPTV